MKRITETIDERGLMMKKLLVLSAVCAMVFAVAGCKEKTPAEKAQDSAAQAAKDAQKAVEQAGKDAGKAADDAGKKLDNAAKELKK